MESIYWARKLTIEKTNQLVNRKSVKKSWVSNQAFQGENAWSVRYPIHIYKFDLAKCAEKPLDHMIMSYVKIGQNKEIQIFLNEINNFCWQRFFIFKELIHVVSSNPENATKGYVHLTQVLTNMHDQNFKTSDSAFWAEEDAKSGAIELLLPKEIVETVEKQYGGYEKISDKEIYEIAYKYKVPKVIVKLRIKDMDVREYFEKAYKSSLYQNAQFLPLRKHKAP